VNFDEGYRLLETEDLPLPARSLDLSAIERAWIILVRALIKHHLPIKQVRVKI
jgi:hypothetical protein